MHHNEFSYYTELFNTTSYKLVLKTDIFITARMFKRI